MKSPQSIPAVQNHSVLGACIKIIAVCEASRVTILSFLGVVLLIRMAFCAPNIVSAQAAAATKPNIVVIMTDDQTLEEMRVLTQTRQLIGGQGTTFRNFYCSYPLCSPSRATFLTGQYAHNHGVFSNKPPSGSYTNLDNSNTLPV